MADGAGAERIERGDALDLDGEIAGDAVVLRPAAADLEQVVGRIGVEAEADRPGLQAMIKRRTVGDDLGKAEDRGVEAGESAGIAGEESDVRDRGRGHQAAIP